MDIRHGLFQVFFWNQPRQSLFQTEIHLIYIKNRPTTIRASNLPAFSWLIWLYGMHIIPIIPKTTKSLLPFQLKICIFSELIVCPLQHFVIESQIGTNVRSRDIKCVWPYVCAIIVFKLIKHLLRHRTIWKIRRQLIQNYGSKIVIIWWRALFSESKFSSRNQPGSCTWYHGYYKPFGIIPKTLLIWMAINEMNDMFFRILSKILLRVSKIYWPKIQIHQSSFGHVEHSWADFFSAAVIPKGMTKAKREVQYKIRNIRCIKLGYHLIFYNLKDKSRTPNILHHHKMISKKWNTHFESNSRTLSKTDTSKLNSSFYTLIWASSRN